MNSLAEITEKAQADIAEAFYVNAQANADASNGLLIAYAPDFERFPYQSLSVRKDRRLVVGNPLGVEDTFSVASVVDKRCKGLEDAIIKADLETEAIEALQNTLDSGTNAIIGSDHLEIVDIAYMACGISAELRKREAAHRSGLVLSKAASDYMGVDIKSLVTKKMPLDFIKEYLSSLGIEVLPDNTVPVRNFLKLAVDLQYLVIPNTDSFANLRGIQQDAVELHNKEVKRDIISATAKRQLASKPPLMLFVAFPGTKTRKLDTARYWQNMQVPGYHATIPEHLPTDVDDINVIGRFADGVVDYAKNCLTFPTTMRLSPEDSPRIGMDNRPINIKSTNRLHLFAHRLIQLVDRVDSSTSVYDKNSNERKLPVVR